MSLDNSIKSSWFGGGEQSLVVSAGDSLNGRIITGIAVSERNFVTNGGAIVFRATLADHTTSVVLAVPQLLTDSHPSADAHFTVHYDLSDGDGHTIPHAIEIAPETLFDFTPFAEAGVSKFYIDSFTQPFDPSLIIGLTFSGNPAGKTVQAIAGAAEIVGIDVRQNNSATRVNCRI